MLTHKTYPKTRKPINLQLFEAVGTSFTLNIRCVKPCLLPIGHTIQPCSDRVA
ncbi:MAG: hypothetical protein KME54_22340 [Tolypothrix brevis GSE-NOS-MK-07-07A]|nr:hypothetical protein [Tolypothrix brevis GSE-NOS-MK-07-07A]